MPQNHPRLSEECHSKQTTYYYFPVTTTTSGDWGALVERIDTRRSTGVRWQPSTTAAEPLDNGRIPGIAPPN